MSGSADLRFGPGKLAGEALEGATARATFTGPNVKLESADVRLVAGHIAGSGNFNTETQAFDFQGRAENIQLTRLASLANRPGLPAVTGVANFDAQISGNFAAKDFSAYQVTFNGRAADVTINGRSAGVVELSGKTQNQRLDVTLNAGQLLGATPQVVSAQINLASERLASTIETTLTNADLTTLLQIALPPNTVRVAGRANGSIKASGNLLDEYASFTLAELSGTANFSELSFRVEDVQLTATTPLTVSFTPNQLTMDAVRFTGPGTNIVLNGTLATAAGGAQNLNINGDLNLRVLNGVSPDFFSSGNAEIAVRINGSYEDPRVRSEERRVGKECRSRWSPYH